MNINAINIPLYNFSIENNATIMLKRAYCYDGPEKRVCFERYNEIHGITLSPWRLSPNNESRIPLRSYLTKAIAIMKLYKEGIPFSDMLLQGNRPIDYLPHFRIWREEKDYAFSKVFHLERNEIKDFQRFWARYIDIEMPNFALQRFALADHEPYDEDMLIKYIECLESLYAPDGNEGLIAYKIASRAALALGQTSKEKTFIHGSIKASYNLRSTITHGRKPKDTDKQKEEVKEKLSVLRDLARRSLRFFHENSALNSTEARLKLLLDMQIKYSTFTLPPLNERN